MLPINRHRLDEELEINAQVMDDIGRSVAKANSLMLEAKKQVEIVEAQESERLREASDKMTNPQIEREVRRSRAYKDAWDHYQRLRHDHEEWESLYKAWTSRSYDLKALGELFAAQYFVIDSVTGYAAKRPGQEEPLRARMRAASDDINAGRDGSTRTRVRTQPPEQEPQPTRPRRRSLVDS